MCVWLWLFCTAQAGPLISSLSPAPNIRQAIEMLLEVAETLPKTDRRR